MACYPLSIVGHVGSMSDFRDTTSAIFLQVEFVLECGGPNFELSQMVCKKSRVSLLLSGQGSLFCKFFGAPN